MSVFMGSIRSMLHSTTLITNLAITGTPQNLFVRDDVIERCRWTHKDTKLQESRQVDPVHNVDSRSTERRKRPGKAYGYQRSREGRNSDTKPPNPPLAPTPQFIVKLFVKIFPCD